MNRCRILNDTETTGWLRALACVSALALLAACASHGPAAIDQSQEASQYAAHARGSYTPPGPPGDPWGPYVSEAAQRFDVPQQWIRAVMAVESGGEEYQGDHLITSPVGAMGLMQVMPETYDDLRSQYNLSDDAYDPHNNILAGAAYMREMYDIYGSPGFLAAYNAGPHRLDDYLANERSLPDETRRYVAMIAPNIEGVYPARRSPAEDYAMNQLPIDIPPGLRYGGVVQVASREPARHWPWHSATRVAHLAESSRRTERGRPERQTTQVAYFRPTSRHEHRGFNLIATAEAAPAPVGHSEAGGWAIQVGAFARAREAEAATSHARVQAHAQLAAAHSEVGTVHAAHATLWRARLGGLSRESAVKACAAMSHSHKNCIVLSPESQS
jgi:cell division protein FtsN